MEEVLLGVDFGDSKTGLAFGRAGLASPLKIVESSDERAVRAEIAKVAVANRVTKIILGLPVDSEGRETDQSRKVRRFGKLLKIESKKPIEFISEFNTSNEAIESAIRSGISTKRRRMDDHIAAALLLKRYYTEREEKEETAK